MNLKERQGAYRLFLKSEFWKDLTRRKKDQVGGKCERCNRTKKLHSHHHRYPANWFDTTFKDLTVLCSICHTVEHFGEMAFSRYGRPWDEEWLLDLTGRLFQRLVRGWRLKRAQRSLLIKLARHYRKDSCLKLHIRNVFRAAHVEWN